MLLKLDGAGKLGCLEEAGLEDMRHGQAPTIRSQDDQLSGDHIIPRARVPQLDNVKANL
jgi:hypothetical protein